MNLWVIFLTGLSIGGLTCLAVQGGLLTTIIAQKYGEDTRNFKAVIAFLVAKFLVYSLLGLILGAFGGLLSISDSVRVIMQFVAGFYMILIAFNLLEVHPIFRYVVIQPPKFLTRLVRGQSKSTQFFAPAILGAMTIFIPCGTTLAMETLAISSGSALAGMLIMATFVLGTVPLFVGLGFLTIKMGDALRKNFFKLAAIALIYLGSTTVYSGLNLVGFTSPIQIEFSQGNTDNPSVQNTSGNIDINVSSYGYSPSSITVKAGEKFKLNFITNNTKGCITSLVIPTEGIRQRLPATGTTSIEITPKNAGQIIFTCSMGMYRGIINVI